MQTPSVGRIVHYQSYGTPGGEYLSEPRAAIITAVHSDVVVSATVFGPAGIHFNEFLDLVEEPTPGCVNWPPRT